MNITFKYSGSEYRSAINQTYSDSNRVKYDVILAIAMLAYGIFRTISESIEIIGGFCIAISLFYLIVIVSRKIIYPIFLFRKNPRYKEVYSLKFNDEVTLTVGSKKTTHYWSYYLGMKESKDFLYLIDGENKYVTIPKRVFKTYDEMNDFIELVRSKINK